MVRLGAAAFLCAVLLGCGSAGSTAGDPPASAGPHFRFFSSRSFWNTPVGADVRAAPRSTAMIAALEAEVEAEEASHKGPWINTTEYSVPIYTVPRDQTRVRVRLASPFKAPALRRALASVPVLPHSEPSPGSDAHLVIWQPATDKLWEFWRLRRVGDEWVASWAGATADVPEAWGAYGPDAWPGATKAWGASASSLSIAGGLITLADLRSGTIDHALALSIPAPRAGVFAAPARRTDGDSADPDALPEGAHLVLDPKLDLAELQLPPLTRMIAAAAQRYGIFVRDRAGNVAFNAEPPRPGTANPYTGEHGLFRGRFPSELLAGFPWDKLEVMPMKLHRYEGRDPGGVS